MAGHLSSACERGLGLTSWAKLQEAVRERGLGKVASLDLADPQLERARQAYREFLQAGLAGEMGYLEKNSEVREEPQQMLPGAKSALVFATAYRGQASGIARYAQGEDYHRILHQRLEELVQWLKGAWPGHEFLRCVDTRPVLERAFAQVAGLGFIGKHGCIIVPGWGSYVFLSVLLSTVEPEAWKGLSKPPLADTADPWDQCASCRRCLDACPTQAFVAPGRLDPRRCISYLTIEYRGEIDPELATGVGERIAGCDRCQEVCPYNLSPAREQRVEEGQWLPPAPSGLEADSLVELAAKGSNQYRRWVRQSALNRIPKNAMLRNIMIALGNSEGLDDEGRALLLQNSQHENSAVAAAAKWALDQFPNDPS